MAPALALFGLEVMMRKNSDGRSVGRTDGRDGLKLCGAVVVTRK